MAKFQSNRIVPIILVVIIVIVVVAAIASIARLFFTGSDSNSTQPVDTSRAELLTTSEGRSVDMVVRGPIVADEEFHSYKITITPSTRTLQTYRGYLGTVVETKQIGNNSAAYEEFVYALDKANLARGKALQGDADDTRGRCATGRVYEFNINSFDQPVKHLWTSTCRGSAGSLDANADQLRQLFLAQIPDSAAPIRGVGL